MLASDKPHLEDGQAMSVGVSIALFIGFPFNAVIATRHPLLLLELRRALATGL